ncbi:MAG: multiheme c-type cytochrome [Candidatus Neomarinimicrobiota bacterium]|nr:multiheme c-type cytochrome [Candidatus Neomarinimicrobiota bacterium]
MVDFEPAGDCKSCHPVHFKEWSGSMHAYALKDPVWFAQHSKEQNQFASDGKELGEFCIMCHSPVAFLTGAIDNPLSFDIGDTASLAPQVQEGVGCSFCHATTYVSPSTDANPLIGETDAIQFFLNTGEIKYGSMKNPIPNSFHDSEFHPDYDRSEMCRACHNLTIDGIDAEMTFTEWKGTAFEAMGIECQSCHMETYSGYAVDTVLFPTASYRENLHRHTFVGLDNALTSFPEVEAQVTAITLLLKSAAEISFGTPLPETVAPGDNIDFSVVVTNISGHNLPTGTTFSRQIWLEVTATAGEDTIYKSGFLNPNGDLYDFYIDEDRTEDPDLTIFRTVLYDAVGDSGLRHVSVGRMVKKSDSTLPVQGSRTAKYSFRFPSDSNEQLSIRVRLRFRAMPPFLTRKLGLTEEANRLIVFDGAELEATIPVNILE